MEGFQPDNGFQQGGFQQGGFQPSSEKGFSSTSDQVRVQGSDIAALRKAVDAAKARIEEADELIKKLEFLPVSTNDPGLSNNGF
ncbi:Ff.00g067180.m01.CDS01 [Fusarium sp. VM40]|nr:Ff.00g067180.m01.CDS01 [Fusarium sp. VM40]